MQDYEYIWIGVIHMIVRLALSKCDLLIIIEMREMMERWLIP